MGDRWPHGIATATYEWTDLAMIQPTQERLTRDEAAMLNDLVA
jgi:hypothetical protein